MDALITVPLWLFILLCALAVLAALDRLLMPSVRWYLRRRVKRVVDELNSRLQLRLEPFKLTRRELLIDRLMYDPDVIRFAEEWAQREGLRRDEVMAKVSRYAQEIVPAFNTYAYFRIGTRLAKGLAQMLYRVRLGYADDAGLSAIPRNASVVFVMNHRSNMDYVLVPYLVATHSALSYAVGEWARVWPLQALIRSLGAYFVRRDSGDPLYRKVLARYVHMATRGGVVQAVFPEGGLSRDGKLRAPRLGLLAYIVKAFDPDGERELVFVPVGINYDRVFEDRSLVRDLDEQSEHRGRAYAVFKSLGFVFHNLGLAARRRWHRFGYAGVRVGEPVFLRDYLQRHEIDFRAMSEAEAFAAVERLGSELMAHVGRAIPVLPVSLVATVMVESSEPLSEFELKGRVLDLVARLAARGAHVHVPRADQDYAVQVGLRMLTLRRLVQEDEAGLYSARKTELALLRYYANAIAHLLDEEDPLTGETSAQQEKKGPEPK